MIKSSTKVLRDPRCDILIMRMRYTNLKSVGDLVSTVKEFIAKSGKDPACVLEADGGVTVLYNLAITCIGRPAVWKAIVAQLKDLTRDKVIPTLRTLIRDAPTEAVRMVCQDFGFGPEDIDRIGVDYLFGNYPPTIVAMKAHFHVRLIPRRIWSKAIREEYAAAACNRMFSAAPPPYAEELLSNLANLVRLAIFDIIVAEGSRVAFADEISDWVGSNCEFSTYRPQIVAHLKSALA